MPRHSDSNLHIAVCSKNRDKISETFIKAHREQLSGTIHYLHDGIIPTKENGKDLLGYYLSRWRQVFPHIFYLKNFAKKEAAGNFYAYLKRSKINVLLAEYGNCGAELTPICKKLCIPLVVHFHGYDAYRKGELANYKLAYQDMFTYASKIISVSSEMTEVLVSLGCRKEKIVYNPYGPATSFYNLQPDLENGYFLFVGRFVEKKAPLLTLLAFKKVQEKRPGAKLVMIGDGILLGTCKMLAKAENINVDFAGAVQHAEIKKYFEGAMCMVQHSVTAEDGDKEGTPVSLIEAGAAGLPVISTRHAGIKDLVVPGETGWLVEEGDINGMASHMLAIYDDTEERKRLGGHARQRVRNFYSLDRHIQQLNTVLTEAAKTN